MTISATDQIFQYWLSLSLNGRVPNRVDVNPANIVKILPSVFILQLDERPSARPSVLGNMDREVVFRLVGGDICDLHTRELTGTPFKDLIAPKDRATAMSDIMRVFSNDEVKRITTRVRSDFAIIDVQSIVMPLCNGEEGTTRALGCQIPMADGCLWWKGSHAISAHQLISIETIEWRTGNVLADPRLQPPAFEVPVLEFSRRARRPEGRMVRHLTVIDGGA